MLVMLESINWSVATAVSWSSVSCV